jgi:hypothetical protein
MMGRLNRQPKKDRTESIGQVLFKEILPENFQELVKKNMEPHIQEAMP